MHSETTRFLHLKILSLHMDEGLLCQVHLDVVSKALKLFVPCMHCVLCVCLCVCVCVYVCVYLHNRSVCLTVSVHVSGTLVTLAPTCS